MVGLSGQNSKPLKHQRVQEITTFPRYLSKTLSFVSYGRITTGSGSRYLFANIGLFPGSQGTVRNQITLLGVFFTDDMIKLKSVLYAWISFACGSLEGIILD